MDYPPPSDCDPSYDWSQYRWVINQVQIMRECWRLLYFAQIWKSEGKIVCNGALKDSVSTSAPLCTISSSPLTAQNIVPVKKRNQSSYQAELGGIYMSIRKLTTAICGKWKIRQGKVTLGYDCKGAIQAVQGGWIITSRWNSYHLLYHINKELRERPIEWEFRWVRGHQDRKKLKKK